MKSILVIGSANIDIQVDTERMPEKGETIFGRAIRYNLGGKGANQAVACGKLGGAVAFLGVVGDEPNIAAMRREMEQWGVNCDALETVSGQASGTAMICVDGQGDNRIIVIPGTNGLLSAKLVRKNRAMIDACGILILQKEIPWEGNREAVGIARALNKVIILNPAPAGGEIDWETLQAVDYLTPNETELALLSGCEVTNLDAAVAAGRKLLDRGIRNLIVTLGNNGSVWIHREGAFHCPSIHVDPVDTTAAGDTFNGAFAVALANGRDVPEAMQFATAASAITVTRSGALESIPTRDEALRLQERSWQKYGQSSRNTAVLQ